MEQLSSELAQLSSVELPPEAGWKSFISPKKKLHGGDIPRTSQHLIGLGADTVKISSGFRSRKKAYKAGRTFSSFTKWAVPSCHYESLSYGSSSQFGLIPPVAGPQTALCADPWISPHSTVSRVPNRALNYLPASERGETISLPGQRYDVDLEEAVKKVLDDAEVICSTITG